MRRTELGSSIVGSIERREREGGDWRCMLYCELPLLCSCRCVRDFYSYSRGEPVDLGPLRQIGFGAWFPGMERISGYSAYMYGG
jgi:hypothetical protein